MSDKAISFIFQKKEKGWNCWYNKEEEHQAEGILTLKNGEDFPCCLKCAKKYAKFKKNRKNREFRQNAVFKSKQTILTLNSFVEPINKPILEAT